MLRTGREGDRTGVLGAAGVGTLASSRGKHWYHPPPMVRQSKGPCGSVAGLLLSPLLFPTLGDRGLDAENSEGAPVPRQTASGAQAADGPGPRGAVSNRGKRVPKEEPWGGKSRASGWGRRQAGDRGGPAAEACGSSQTEVAAAG